MIHFKQYPMPYDTFSALGNKFDGTAIDYSLPRQTLLLIADKRLFFSQCT